MKTIMMLLVLSFTYSAWAALPLLQYSWHNQVSSSQLMIFDDGSILHQERIQYQNQTLQQPSLTSQELEELKNLIQKVLSSDFQTEEFETALGSYSGTIELRQNKGLKIVEGVVRDSTDLYRGKAYRSDSPSMNKLKAFIFKYTQNDMEF